MPWSSSLSSSVVVSFYPRWIRQYIPAHILRQVYAYGLDHPSAIQQRAIVPIIKGQDVVIQAQPIAGDRATFSIPILQKIDHSIKYCQALILAHTDELGSQIQKVVTSLSNFMEIESYACIGSTTIRDNTKALRDGRQIIIGTPDRIEKMFKTGALNTDHLNIFLLYRTDEMLSVSLI